MNLVSCDECGVVLDKSKLDFPTDIWDKDGGVIDHLASWDGDGYVLKVQCPVCKSDIWNMET